MPGRAAIALPLPPHEGEALPARHRDNCLQTTLEGEKLQARLTRLAQQAASSLDERGTNTLYVSLGVVAWRETAGSEVVSRAPLLLVPVEPTRTSVNRRHVVRISDEDVVANPCLLELGERRWVHGADMVRRRGTTGPITLAHHVPRNGGRAAHGRA